MNILRLPRERVGCFISDGRVCVVTPPTKANIRYSKGHTSGLDRQLPMFLWVANPKDRLYTDGETGFYLFEVETEGDEVLVAPFAMGNVDSAYGFICWGGGNKAPKDLRAAMAQFWFSPFNDHWFPSYGYFDIPDDKASPNLDLNEVRKIIDKGNTEIKDTATLRSALRGWHKLAVNTLRATGCAERKLNRLLESIGTRRHWTPSEIEDVNNQADIVIRGLTEINKVVATMARWASFACLVKSNNDISLLGHNLNTALRYQVGWFNDLYYRIDRYLGYAGAGKIIASLETKITKITNSKCACMQCMATLESSIRKLEEEKRRIAPKNNTEEKLRILSLLIPEYNSKSADHVSSDVIRQISKCGLDLRVGAESWTNCYQIPPALFYQYYQCPRVAMRPLSTHLPKNIEDVIPDTADAVLTPEALSQCLDRKIAGQIRALSKTGYVALHHLENDKFKVLLPGINMNYSEKTNKFTEVEEQAATPAVVKEGADAAVPV